MEDEDPDLCLGGCRCCGSLVVAAGTAGKGGPASADLLLGWDGVVGASGGVRYVALPGRGTTTVAGVRIGDGRVLRFATVRGLLGIPQVTWDGTTDGISANGQRLVLASITSRPLAVTTTFVVLRANTLGVQRRIELSGHWVFDAISPDGSTIYAVQYADLSHYSVRAKHQPSTSGNAGEWNWAEMFDTATILPPVGADEDPLVGCRRADEQPASVRRPGEAAELAGRG